MTSDELWEVREKFEALRQEKDAEIERLRAERDALRAMWRAMAYAPLDGTRVKLLIRHQSWWAAHKAGSDESIWKAVFEGHWIDHNGGGWTWSGMAGTPIGWKPLDAARSEPVQYSGPETP